MTPITESIIADYIAAIYTALEGRLTEEEQSTITPLRRDHYYIDLPFLGESALLLCDHYRLLITPVAPAQVHYLIGSNSALYVTSANENEGGERYSRIYIDTPERLLDCKPILQAIYDAQKQISLKKKPTLIGFQRAFAEAANIPWALEALAPDMETELDTTVASAPSPEGIPEIQITDGTPERLDADMSSNSLALYTVFDIETTGLDPNTDEIIEISAIRVENGQQVAEFSALIQPTGNLVSLDITQLTGITNDMLIGKPTIQTVMPRFLEFIGDTPLVGHNIGTFDIPFCNRVCVQIGCSYIKNQYIDTLSLARQHLQLDNYQLCTVAAAFDVFPATAHRALADCETTILCFEALKKLHASPFVMKQPAAPKVSDAKPNSSSGKAKINAGDYIKYAKRPKAKDIRPTRTEFDPNHPLYRKTCVFSGDLETMSRETAMRRTVNVGGLCADGITKTTNFLIIQSSATRKTTKQKKAEEYMAQGLAIKIITEAEFLEMLEQENAPSGVTVVHNAKGDLIAATGSQLMAHDEIPAQIERIYRGFINALTQSTENYDLEKVQLIYRTPRKTPAYYVITLFGQSFLSFAGQINLYMEVSQTVETLFHEAEVPILHDRASGPPRILAHEFSFDVHKHLAVECYEEYLRTDGFDCCSRYMECSEAGFCKQEDIMLAGQCSYRQKLRKGIIYYGSRRNVGQSV